MEIHKLYYSPTCNSTHQDGHTHPAYIQPFTVAEIFTSFLLNPQYIPFNSWKDQALRILSNLKDQIDCCMKQIERETKVIFIQNSLSTKSQQVAEACLSIIQKDYKDIRCKTVSNIIELLNKTENTVFNDKFYKQYVCKQIKKQLQKPIQQFESFINQIVNQSDTKQTQSYSHDQKQTYRKKRGQNRKDSWEYPESMKIQAKDKDERNSQKRQDVKVRQANIHEGIKQQRPKIQQGKLEEARLIESLENQPENTKFSIRVKVIKIIKHFDISSFRMIEWVGGDETGTSTIVTSQNDTIKIDNVIEITACKIYLFQKRIRQIQDTKDSKYYLHNNIQLDVCYDLDITDHRNNRNSKPNNRRNRESNRDNEGQREKVRNRNRNRRPRNENNFSQTNNQTDDRNRRSKRTSEYDESRQNSDSENEQKSFRRDNQKNNKIDERFRKQDNQRQIRNRGQVNQSYRHRAANKEREQPNHQQSALIKIGDIEPGDQNISLIVQIYKVIKVDDWVILCEVGDETGIVRAELPETLNYIKQGNCIKISEINAQVIQSKIILIKGQSTRFCHLQIKLPLIKFTNNISEAEWLSEDEQS